MLNPEDLYEEQSGMLSHPRIQGLPLLVSLEPPHDIGGTAYGVADVLRKELEHIKLAEFDFDQLCRYRERSLHSLFRKGLFDEMSLPEVNLYLMEDHLKQPFLLLAGAEPDYQWQRFVQAILRIIRQVKSSYVMLVSGYAMSFPHTRPIVVTIRGSYEEVVAPLRTVNHVFEMHQSHTDFLEYMLARQNIKTVKFNVHVPRYLGDNFLPQAVLRALEHITLVSKLSLPLEKMVVASGQAQKSINEMFKDNQEIAFLIKKFEEEYDRYMKHYPLNMLELDVQENDSLLDRETIGQEIEKYLEELGESSSSDSSNADKPDSPRTS
ncbi:PAC2 family protein [Rothia sp. CCM 9419]|uniref:PAC2 family protein n=1 Tax=Rothia sp. CCM 9419 TaxID=3402662 RepID=UPI003AEE7C91